MIKKNIIIEDRYLILPVKRGPTPSPTLLSPYGAWPKKNKMLSRDLGHLRIKKNNKVLFWFDIKLVSDSNDYEVFLDLKKYLGENLVIEYEGKGTTTLDGIFLSKTPIVTYDLYKETLRPQFHFSSRRGWNNDPNGLFYYDGYYHLLYQHNPYSTDSNGNLHWGHAISKNLINWSELPIALYPDKLGTISTGSSVVDYNNTSGLGKNNNPAIVSIYTSGHASYSKEFTQCIAFSNDGGWNWEKFKGNPVMGHIIGKNRDPKVFWHDDTNKWIMVLYLDKSDYGIFSSNNLINWVFLSKFTLNRATECPELFPLNVDCNVNDKKWVFCGANSTYSIGSFDGNIFLPEQENKKLQLNGNSYAAQTWSNIPNNDGRRIQISWMRQILPNMPFGQFMSFPHSLTLTRKNDEIYIKAKPIEEINLLYNTKWNISLKELTQNSPIEADITSELYDIELEYQMRNSEKVAIDLRGIRIWYSKTYETLFCGTYSVPLKLKDGKFNLRVLVDKASIEIYADDGTIMVAIGVILEKENKKIVISTQSGVGLILNMKVISLKSSWKIFDE